MTHALLECTYCNGWAVLAHATIQDDVEVVIGWIQEPADDADNWKGLQIHTKNRQLGETYENIYYMRIAVSSWVMWAGMLGRVKLKLWVCFRIGRFENIDVRVKIICCFRQNNVYGWLVAVEAVFTYIYLFTVCLQTGGREQKTEGLL